MPDDAPMDVRIRAADPNPPAEGRNGYSAGSPGLIAGKWCWAGAGWAGSVFRDVRGQEPGRPSGGSVFVHAAADTSRSTSARSTISTPTLTHNESWTRRPAGFADSFAPNEKQSYIDTRQGKTRSEDRWAKGHRCRSGIV